MFKKVLLLCCLVAATTSISAQNNDWANLKRYAQANAELMEQPNNGQRVVFMGNSITEGWVRTRPQFFTENGFVGRGISGQTSYQFLVRFREDVVNLNPAVVVINYGTNDIAENTGPYNEDYTVNNVMSMVEIAQANGIKVILASTLPAAAFPWRKSITDAPEKIVPLNARIKQYAKDHKIPYVDYYSKMLADDKRSLKKEYSNDGVHPTLEGYLVMEQLVLKAIKKVLK